MRSARGVGGGVEGRKAARRRREANPPAARRAACIGTYGNHLSMDAASRAVCALSCAEKREGGGNYSGAPAALA